MDKTRHREIGRFLGSLIARKRSDADMTQDQVAEHLGIGFEAVSRIERGVISPNFQRIIEFCEIFDCRLVDLLLPASDRDCDQVDELARLASELSSSDRKVVVDLARRLHGSKPSIGKA